MGGYDTALYLDMLELWVGWFWSGTGIPVNAGTTCTRDTASFRAGLKFPTKHFVLGIYWPIYEWPFGSG